MKQNVLLLQQQVTEPPAATYNQQHFQFPPPAVFNGQQVQYLPAYKNLFFQI